MKLQKSMIFAGVAAVLAFSACKKDKTTTTGSNGQFSINGTSYAVSSVIRTSTVGNYLTCTDVVDSQSVILLFSTFPAADTTMPVGDDNGQLSIVTGNAAGTGGFANMSTPLGTTNVTVKVSSGKLTVTVPDTYLYKTNASGGEDSAKFSCSIHE